MHSFKNLKKIDLSENEIETLPPANVFAGMASLQFLYLHNNNISKWQDLQSLVSMPEIMHIRWTTRACQHVRRGVMLQPGKLF